MGGVSGLTARQVKVLAPQSDDPSSIPDIHRVEEGNWPCLLSCSLTSTHAQHTEHMLVQKQIIKNVKGGWHGNKIAINTKSPLTQKLNNYGHPYHEVMNMCLSVCLSKDFKKRKTN